MEEEKDKKKQLVIIGITILLICVGLSGCLGDEGTKELTDSELIIGNWETSSGDKWTFTETKFFKGNWDYYYVVKSTTENMTLGEAPYSNAKDTRHGFIFTWITKTDYESKDYSNADWYTFRFEENDILKMSQGLPDPNSWVLYRVVD